MRQNDDELIADYLGGNERSLDCLIDRYAPQVFAFAVHSLGRREPAEEICQEAFLKMVRSLGAYRPQGRFKVWLFTIVRNACVDFQRQVRFLPVQVAAPVDTDALDPVELIPSTEPSILETLHRQELRLAVTQAIDLLSREQREVFLLKENAGFTFDEIAGLLNVPAGTVKSRMRYALRNIRQHLVAKDFTKEMVLE